ncbi:MAG: hypothetical protein U9N43_07640 [Euryarchaeota archaeon]|nr:hypothetical protein [Euryarchaeota archaeon]
MTLMADLVDVMLWVEEGNGKVLCEITTVPGKIFEPRADRYVKLLSVYRGLSKYTWEDA